MLSQICIRMTKDPHDNMGILYVSYSSVFSLILGTTTTKARLLPQEQGHLVLAPVPDLYGCSCRVLLDPYAESCLRWVCPRNCTRRRGLLLFVDLMLIVVEVLAADTVSVAKGTTENDPFPYGIMTEGTGKPGRCYSQPAKLIWPSTGWVHKLSWYKKINCG